MSPFEKRHATQFSGTQRRSRNRSALNWVVSLKKMHLKVSKNKNIVIPAIIGAAFFGLLPSSSFGYQVNFCAPSVLCGITGVFLNLPSGGSGLFDIELQEGIGFNVYGNPPLLDLNSEADAVYVMDEASQAINSFLALDPDATVTFGPGGGIGYSLPWKFDPPKFEYITIDSFGSKPAPPSYLNPIVPKAGNVPGTSRVVWAKINPVPVPAPVSIFSIMVAYSSIEKAKRLSLMLKKRQ